MNRLRDFFGEHGFTINPLEQECFWAQRAGRNSLLLKFVDFYFVKEISDISDHDVTKFHEKSIKTANKQFKVPKALRLTVPNISSILFTNDSPSQAVIDLVSKRNRSLIGGQQETIFIVDQEHKKLFCPGIEITRIMGEAKLLWGNQKEFNKLNGHNRAYYFIMAMLQELYGFEA